MDIDNEAVDWGYDDDLPPVSRNSSYEQVAQVGHGDADDVEDYVSLGEDDEDQGYFYQHQNLPETDPSTNVAQATKEDSERPHSAQARDDTTGANNATRARYRSREDDRGARSRNRGRRMSSESPYRRESSNRRASPQRSQQNSARITHALPPKPSTQVFYIPPSHSSKIEAVGMTSLSPPSRSAIREGKKSNGASTKRDISPDISDHRERRYPRQGADIPNHNREFPETSRNIPVSNTSTSNLDTSQSRRRRASPSGNMPLIPNSNASHSQTSRSHRERQYSRPENGREDLSRPSSPGANGLSYKDRHYVPSSSADVRMVERPEDVPLPSKSRYDRSPSSPPRQRRRPRSISPLPDDIRGSNYPSREKGYDSFRGSERLRGRDGIINEPDTMREAPPMSHDAGRRWSAPRRAFPVDVARDERGLRVPPDRPPQEDYTYDQRYIDDRNRPVYKRRDSSRGPEREREPEHARPSERTTRRERPIDNQDFIPSPRYRSPPPPRERETRHDYGHRQGAAEYPPAGASSNYRDRPSRDVYPSASLQHGHQAPLASPRTRDYDRLPEPPMGQPSRYDERDHQRRRREPSPENTNLPRRPNVYPDEPTNARYPDRNMTAAPTMRDRSPPPPESASARKRQPLPPQTKIFQSASSSGSSLRRDAPPHIATGTVQLSSGWADKDPNVPRAPRQRDELVRRPSPAQRPPPPVDTKMDVDHEDRPKSSGRPLPYDQRAEMEARISHAEANARPRPHPGGPPPRAKYPERRNEDADPGPGRRNEVRSMNNGPPPREFRGRPEDAPRKSGPGSGYAPVSGTNNVPIGVRHTHLPPEPPAVTAPPPVEAPQKVEPYVHPPLHYDPRARPPSSLLINPPKLRDGKQAYERPANTPLPFNPSLPPKPETAPPPDRTDAQSATTTAPESQPAENPKPRRESRFSARETAAPSTIAPKTNTREEENSVLVPPASTRKQRSLSPSGEGPPTTAKLYERTMAPSNGQMSKGSQEPISSLQAPQHQEKSVAESTPHDRKPQNDARVPPSPALQSERQPQQPTPLASAASESTASLESSVKSRQRRSRWGDNDNNNNARRPADLKSTPSSSNLSARMSIDQPPSLARRMSDSRVGGQNNNNNNRADVSMSTSGSQNEVITLRERVETQSRPTLLDRMKPLPPPADTQLQSQPQSLRDRLVPSKRDRHDMLDEGHAQNGSYDGDDGNDNKRAKRRNVRTRRGGGRR